MYLLTVLPPFIYVFITVLIYITLKLHFYNYEPKGNESRENVYSVYHTGFCLEKKYFRGHIDIQARNSYIFQSLI